MKQLLKLTALLAVATLALTSCNPETEDNVPVKERDITYTVDGNTKTVHLTTDAEFETLLDRFCDYAENGSNVTFYNAGQHSVGNSKGTKDIVTYSTTNRENMKRWMRAQEDAGRTVTVTYDPTSGTYNGAAYATAPHPQNDNTYWVDLGLPSGLLWAKCNVGATQPEDSGYFFAWGETWPKNDYSWSAYTYCHNGDCYSLTKYSHFSNVGYNGYTDTLTVLQPGDDAATVNIGGGARTPTYYEWKELQENCTFEWVTQNGMNGLRCTGPNGNSIFLPDAGNISSTSVNIWGYYWSANISVNIPCYNDVTTGACSFKVDENGLNFFRSERHIGMKVRPVRSTH